MRETKGDVSLAQYRARELINFSRRGSDNTLLAASRVIPFMNAYVQGMDMVYRTVTGVNSATGLERSAARRQFYKKAMVATALGFMYALVLTDDEGYQEQLDEIRDGALLIPNADVKIPIPRELGFLFKSIPERLVGYYRSQGTEEEQSIISMLSSMTKAGLSAYGTPNGVPTLIKPLLENFTNYSFFLQRELESPALKNVDPSQRVNSDTSELAKVIGNLSQELGNVAGTKVVEVSPIDVDNLLRGLFGLAGSTTLLMTDGLINPTRADRPIHKLPFASLFLTDPTGGRAKKEFYDLSNKVSNADATFKYLLKSDPEKAQKYLEQNEILIAAAPTLRKQAETISNLRRQRVMYETSSDAMLGMTGAERRKAIDEIRKVEAEYAREFVKGGRSLLEEDDGEQAL